MGMFYGHNQVMPPTIYTYGLLYNIYAVNNSNFAPSGWHVPSETEYITLIDTLGGASVAGGKLKETGTTHWLSPNTGATNSSGFNAFGGGYRDSGGSFYYMTYIGWYYTTTSGGSESSNIYLTLENSTADASSGHFEYNKNLGVSVRLIKNDSNNFGSISDYDGNIYNTVKIGDQVWTVQNWKCTHYNNGTVIPEVTDNTTWAGLTTGALCAYDNDWSYV